MSGRPENKEAVSRDVTARIRVASLGTFADAVKEVMSFARIGPRHLREEAASLNDGSFTFQTAAFQVARADTNFTSNKVVGSQLKMLPNRSRVALKDAKYEGSARHVADVSPNPPSRGGSVDCSQLSPSMRTLRQEIAVSRSSAS